jgi:predicted transposase YdaD
MSKRFDATVKHLLEAYPDDWMRFVGLPGGRRVEAVDADLSTITTEADKVFRVRDRRPWLLHLELQAGRDRQLPRRVLRYNVLLGIRHDLPVQSIVVLLRSQAEGRELSGLFQQELPNGHRYLEFRYQVVRTWQQPVERILSGGLGTLPLAPLSNVQESSLPEVVRRMDERLSREASPGEASSLWSATYVLMGLRYDLQFSGQLLQGVRSMRESVTYRAIVAEEAKKILMLQGRKLFGPPDARTSAVLDRIKGLDRLERLTERLLDVSSWEELLADRTRRRRNGNRQKPS